MLVTYVGILYKSLRFGNKQKSKKKDQDSLRNCDDENERKSLDEELHNLWDLIKSLLFINVDKLDDMNKIIELCDNNNYHWLLVYCFHLLNKQLFINDEAFCKDFALIFDKYGVFTLELKHMMEKEVNKESKYALNGVHLERLWRFISILSFAALPLIESWIKKTKSNKTVNKLIIDKYHVWSKKIDQLKRTLTDTSNRIESSFKMINIEQKETNNYDSPNKDKIDKKKNQKKQSPYDKQLEKTLKKHEINQLIVHKSSINLDKNIKIKHKLQEIKIAMININNNLLRNNVDILKQNILMLKQ